MATRARKPETNKASLREAWVEITSKKPWLVKEALEHGLASSRPLGYLELGARLMKEVGAQDEQKTQIAIIFNGTLDANKLKGSTVQVLNGSAAIPVSAPPQLQFDTERQALPEVLLELNPEEAELLEADA